MSWRGFRGDKDGFLFEPNERISKGSLCGFIGIREGFCAPGLCTIDSLVSFIKSRRSLKNRGLRGV